MAGRSTRRPARTPTSSAVPSPARTSTANRLTPQPCARSNDANDAISDWSGRGCDVCAIWPTMPASVPGTRPTVPCQNPRPGQAWSTAAPSSRTPVARSTNRPSCGPIQARSGSATRAPATT